MGKYVKKKQKQYNKEKKPRSRKNIRLASLLYFSFQIVNLIKQTY